MTKCSIQKNIQFYERVSRDRMPQKCASSGSRQRDVSEAKSSQHDITKSHIKLQVFKSFQKVSYEVSIFFMR